MKSLEENRAICDVGQTNRATSISCDRTRDHTLKLCDTCFNDRRSPTSDPNALRSHLDPDHIHDVDTLDTDYGQLLELAVGGASPAGADRLQ